MRLCDRGTVLCARLLGGEVVADMYCHGVRADHLGVIGKRKMTGRTAGFLVIMYLVATASAGVNWDTVTFNTPTAEPGMKNPASMCGWA